MVNHQPADSLVARMTSRDSFLERDTIGIIIYASGEGLFGYGVSLSLGDSMFDFSLLPERRFNLQWDGSWDGRTQIVDEGWSAEFFVPWSMMPLPQVEGERKIGLAFRRALGQRGEVWTSPPLPDTLNVFISGAKKYLLKDIEPRRQLTLYPVSVCDGIRHDANSRVVRTLLAAYNEYTFINMFKSRFSGLWSQMMC